MIVVLLIVVCFVLAVVMLYKIKMKDKFIVDLSKRMDLKDAEIAELEEKIKDECNRIKNDNKLLKKSEIDFDNIHLKVPLRDSDVAAMSEGMKKNTADYYAVRLLWDEIKDKAVVKIERDEMAKMDIYHYCWIMKDDRTENEVQ